MPLPADQTPWPPEEWKPINNQIRIWDAWWTGNPVKLEEVYKNGPGQTETHGVLGRIQKFFWGRQTTNNNNRPSRTDLHVPIAADICATAADLVYGTPPKVESDAGLTAETSQRITEYEEAGLYEQLLEGAELGAALTGRYHQVVVDPALSDKPFINTVAADHAIPTFQWGKLTAVTFWSTLHRDGTIYYRHVETHELQNGMGVTYHGLYQGTASTLGQRISLDMFPETRGLQTAEDGQLLAPKTPGLAVVYVPNTKPQRRWRNNPQGRNLGRSDLDGLESLMDALDETYNSWMRDLRLGKARVFVDRSTLEQNPNRPQTNNAFDLDQEIYAPLENIGRIDSGKFIQAEQFNIRVQEHATTAQNLANQIVRAARYSTATFDDTQLAGGMTATEIRARLSTTAATRDRKLRFERPALLELIRKMLTLDTAIFNTPGLAPENVTIRFPDLTQTGPLEAAQTVSALNAAEAASLETKVGIAHPDWDTDQISEEVDRIRNEAPLLDPTQWQPN